MAIIKKLITLHIHGNQVQMRVVVYMTVKLLYYVKLAWTIAYMCSECILQVEETPPTVRPGKHRVAHSLKRSGRVRGSGHEVGDCHLIEQERAVLVVF